MRLGRDRLLMLVVVLLGVRPLCAQVVRLPAIEAAGPVGPFGDPSEMSHPWEGQLVSYPGSAAQLLQAPGELDLPEQPHRPPDARPGMFQKLIFTGAWLARGPGDDFGTSDLELKSVLALPIPSREYPLIVTPGFGVHYLDGPISRDLPARVYDAYGQIRWMRRLGPQLGIDLAVTQGVFSDFEHGDGTGYRITGHGVAAWTCRPTLKIVLGAAYIDRFSTDVLPVCGLVWTPHDDVKFDLVFPHPRIARRIYLSGLYDDDVQDWLYVAGELGGGTWAIAQGGDSQMIDYTDYRLFLGIQRKVLGGLDTHLEIGYVFQRKIRFETATPEFRPGDTVMLRGGLTY
jgi:hypothetical protein